VKKWTAKNISINGIRKSSARKRKLRLKQTKRITAMEKILKRKFLRTKTEIR
jgi:hypothetical protein